MKKIAILGSTGSIGTQTLEIVRDNPDIQEWKACLELQRWRILKYW